jgi:DNA-binding LacI/PurR family transcriptional regulator
MHDIAREAGVSIATVSRVINNPSIVEEATRDRVLAVITANDYTPNALARGLLNNRTRSVGVLTVDILNPYYATVVHSIERSLSSQGNNILLCNTGGSQDEKARYIRTLLEKRVDGLVFVGSVYRERDGTQDILAAARSLPVIMINSIIKAENVYCVLCDDRRGIRIALDGLIRAGRRRLLFINTTSTSSARIKEQAFRERVSEMSGEGLDTAILETSPEDLQELPGRIERLLGEKPFDAILATDDLFANVAVNCLHALHARIPEDVWVMGYNDSYLCDQTFPRLSSVDSRMEDLGRSAAEILSRLLAGGEGPDRIRYLEPRIVWKDSTGPT